VLDVLQSISPAPYLIFALIFGALWGSFANVVIERWPRELSVVTPGSHCFACQTAIRWYDNLPVISFLLLRGRCRHCGTRYSPRYLIVELLMALLSGAILQMTVLSAPAIEPSVFLEYLLWFAFAFSMLVISMIDLQHYLIPDAIVLPGILVGITANLFFLPLGWREPVLTAFVAYVSVRLLFIDGYRLLRGQPGMGHGDAKLLAMCGAFMGAQGVLFTLFAGALQGSVVGILMVLHRRRHGMTNEPVFEEEQNDADEALTPMDPRLATARVPFGPFLCLGALQYLFIGQWLLSEPFDAVLRRVFTGG
jgi:leader peptidase (prepilin peptidase) / N-methyltransferase